MGFKNEMLSISCKTCDLFKSYDISIHNIGWR